MGARNHVGRARDRKKANKRRIERARVKMNDLLNVNPRLVPQKARIRRRLARSMANGQYVVIPGYWT